jgi:D-alanyl-D-alanine endopeptidase (penicillin-binding protein 7)
MTAEDEGVRSKKRPCGLNHCSEKTVLIRMTKAATARWITKCLALSLMLVIGLSSQTSDSLAATSSESSSAAKANKKSQASSSAAKKSQQAKSTQKTRKAATKTSTRTSKSTKPRQSLVKRDPTNRMSAGTRLGLRSALTDVALNSSAVLVVDQISGEVLLEKNPNSVLPIASITKLMTALVVAEAELPMDEKIFITQDDADLEKYSKSRLKVGTQLTRAQVMHLALMSSENRAAHALGRTYPGGMAAFVEAMNIKALQLGMKDSKFVEPTGLNAGNVSSPRDLVRLVEEAHQVSEIREFSTAKNLVVKVGGRSQQYMNSNALARGDRWELGLSKTGFIKEAGRCLVMQAEVEDRPVIMVMLDAQGKNQRLRDAERIRRWLIQQAENPKPNRGDRSAPQARLLEPAVSSAS